MNYNLWIMIGVTIKSNSFESCFLSICSIKSATPHTFIKAKLMQKNVLRLQNVENEVLSTHYLVSISSLIIHYLSALGLRKDSNGVSNIELQALLKREYNCSLYDNNLCSIVH